MALSLASASSAETLRDAVIAAYNTNPQLAEARARQQALAETPEQARAIGRLTAETDAAGGYNRFDYDKGGTYAQRAVAVASSDIELLDHQVAEAQSRFKLGQATRTDVAQVEAQRASAAATLADAQGSAAAIAATYLAAVGRAPQTLDATVPQPRALPGSVEAAKTLAVAANPVVDERRLNARADAARIDQQRAERNPYVALGGTFGYAAGDRQSGYTTAVGGLTFRLPLLTGGLVGSRVRQAEATYRADHFAVDGAEREAARAAETAWANLVAAQSRSAANQRRAEAADLALKGVRAEYGFSLRTTLDILIADESLRAARLALARSRSDVLIAQAALLRAVGRLGPTSYSGEDARS